MKKSYNLLLVLFLGILSLGASAQTTSFGSAGTYTYVVPAGTVAVAIDLAGAQGGNGCNYGGYPGGQGGRVQCQMTVTPGQTLYIIVGGVGGYNNGGYPGGGNGSSYGGGGGGYTVIKSDAGAMSPANALVVGGAGGGGDCYYGDGGGPGGGLVGGNGLWGCSGTCGSYDSYNDGAGGNTTAATGGAGGYGGGNNGSFGQGGDAYCCYYGGAGGGGFYGGGGGYAGSGGGGSSYTDPASCSAVTHTQGYESGDGYVNITALHPTVTVAPASLSFGYVTAGSTSVPPQYFSMNGSILTAGGTLTMTPPANYALSVDGISWGAPGAAVTYTYPGSAFTGKNVYVRFSPTAIASYSGNITITGGGLLSAVNIALAGNGSANCSGTPTAGTASISPASGGSATPFTLTLAGTSASGNLFYQWQSGPALAGPFTNIPGAITPSYNLVGISATTYFRCVVTCGTGASANSTVVTAASPGSIASSACTVPNASGGVCCGFYVANASHPFSVPGDGGTQITDNTNLSGTNYVDKSGTMSCTMHPGGTYTTTIAGGSTNQMSFQMWIDFNGNGTFESSETVGGASWSGYSSAQNPVITIPAGVPFGTYRMRAMVDYNCCGAPYYPSYPALPPCPILSGITQPYYYEVRDYKVSIGVPPCSGTPSVGIVSSTPTSSCATFSPFLYNTGESIANTGLIYQWQSSTTSPVSGFSNIPGATGQGYVASISATGPVYYRQTVTCAGNTAVSAATSDTLLPVPNAISGVLNICVGNTSTLSSTTSGGIWTSSNPAVATVGSLSGLVTGVTGGSTAVITYTLPQGCFVTAVVTINTNPAAITGPSIVCPLTNITLADATGGGTWSSSNTALATVGASTGVVTGVSGGIVAISYTIPNGCVAIKLITVNTTAPITGTLSICLGYSSALSDAIGGGTWASSAPSIVSIGSSSGSAFGVAPGNATISYTFPNGCVTTALAAVSSTPTVFTITGGGNFCAGGAGVHIGTTGSNIGINYQLVSGGLPIGPFVTGSGGPVDLGLVTTPGVYTVVANYGSPCALTMTGTAIVGVYSAPAAYTVTGGGSFCAGGAGVHVYLNGSNTGISYQLFNSVTPSGAPVTGTTAVLDFGLQTAGGTYTVVGTDLVTGCITTMTGGVTVTTNPVPAAYNVTGGGSFCAGGPGVGVGLGNSVAGINYQLFRNGIAIGAPVSASGGPFSFGNQTLAGTYTATATNPATGCTANMTGSVVVSVTALPPVNTVTGGGAFCTGGTGVHIGLNGSASGISYQLYNGALPVGGPVTGSGALIDFGVISAAGTYTVVATVPLTTCTSNMTGSATVSVNPGPSVSGVTGGGSYCSGTGGVHIGLSGSVAGTNYYLYNGAVLAGGASGTGTAIDFGSIIPAGTYTVSATIAATGCAASMTGSAIVSINSLPAPYAVSLSSPGSYCSGGIAPHVLLAASASGVNYQLMLNGTATGLPLAGSGALDFGTQPLPGTYTVVATNTTTGCVNTMTGSPVIAVNPLPGAYLVTGGGSYCAGGNGVHVGISGSDTGVRYQLTIGGLPSGSLFSGTGAALDFGLDTASGTYGVTATRTSTSCVNTMSGTTTISILPQPVAYAVTGGGSYCNGGAGVHVGLSGSDAGINYQLFRGTVPAGIPAGGSGSTVDFGLQTAAGTYTVSATNTATGCMANMSGSSVVSVNPLPVAFAVGGGGNYCPGGSGVHITLSGSATGVTYQLYSGVTATGAPVTGTGSALDLGLQTVSGVYTVVGSSALTTCINNMSGSASVGLFASPGIHNVTGGGSFYCSGGAGVHVGLDGSDAGVTYQLFRNGILSGAPIPGSGAALDFGAQTLAGNYTVVATITATGCNANMAGGAVINVVGLPSLHLVTGGGNYCPGGTGVLVGLDGSDPDPGVSYQLYLGTLATGSPVAGTGSAINFGLQATAGVYSVVANNSINGCSNVMSGTTSVGISALPVVHTVTGSGNYCSGGSGLHILLDGSEPGINYSLLDSGIVTSAMLPGSGAPLDFGAHTTGVYTVKATSVTTGCTNTMTGTATVVASNLPGLFTVTGGGSYCAGGNGLSISLSGSETGVVYQVYTGGVAVGSPIAGTGAAISSGLLTTAGTFTVIATNLSTTCTNTMTGAATIAVSPLPAPFSVTGGGPYCASGAGSDIMLSGSTSVIMYQLFNGTTATGVPLYGTGSPLDFGNQTVAGTYSVKATDPSTGCSAMMTGTSAISVLPLPALFTVTGGGAVCPGGTGADVSLSGSSTGISYQLYNTGVAVGSAVPGTGSSIDFGIQTTLGSYSVVATNSVSGCFSYMTGSATIAAGALPAVYTVAGSSSNGYCAGGTGVVVFLSGSDPGVGYQLYRGTTPVGSSIAGSGGLLSFGPQAAVGNYTVTGVDLATGCTSAMAGSVSVSINPLPDVYNVTGGGGYCNGGSGVHIGLSGSHASVYYQLLHSGVAVDSAVAGTGSTVDLGLANIPGSYTVMATNSVTGCQSSMTGTAVVSLLPAPAALPVTGGGSYCAGGTGEHVGLSSSSSGVSYQLYHNGAATGPAHAGIGVAIDFGLQTLAGTYTVIGTSASNGCTQSMTGSAAINIVSLPAPHAISGGGSFCAGGSGVEIGLSGSNTGVVYRLYNGSSLVGSAVIGTGFNLSFGDHTTPGTYTVIATDATSACISTMPGSAAVMINALPDVFPVTGGGNYCAGGTGVHIGLAGSSSAIEYHLLYAGSSIAVQAGSGLPVDFGLQTTAGSYNVQAVNVATGCMSDMSGIASVVITPVVLPAVDISTGIGDTVCSGNLTTFSAIATASGPSPAFEWTVNGVVTGVGSSYSYIPVDGDVVGITLTSSAACAAPATVTDNAVITVLPKALPSVSISANPGTEVCHGASVLFTATPVYGGSSPAYTWMKGTVVVGAGPVFSFLPQNGDVISCKLNSNYQCRQAPSATSTAVTMVVDTPATPVVSLTAYPGLSIGAGETPTIQASVTNGGPAPQFSWLVNGVVVPGANLSSFTSNNFTDNEIITCNVLSSGGCSGIAGGSSLTVHVSNVGVHTLPGAQEAVSVLPNPNNGTFLVKGTFASGVSEVSVDVTDLLGQKIYSKMATVSHGELNHSISLGNTVANGMYLLTLRTGNETLVYHIVVRQ